MLDYLCDRGEALRHRIAAVLAASPLPLSVSGMGSLMTIHAVRAVGPGWDWTTFVRMYPSVDTCTAQLRAFESVVVRPTRAIFGAALFGTARVVTDSAGAEAGR